MTLETPPSTSGVFVMLDALGTRSLSASETQQFIEKRTNLLKDTNTELEAVSKLGEAICQELGVQAQYRPPRVVTFADNVLLFWEINDSQAASDDAYVASLGYLVCICDYLGTMIKVALRKGHLWRGAVSFGEYVQENGTVLGPAVNDAANWCEKADWIGIIATPSCGMRLLALEEFYKESVEGKNSPWPSKLGRVYTKYEVPMKGGVIEALWVICWPYKYFAQTTGADWKLEGKLAFLRDIGRFMIPLGTENKYKNTIEFFEWFTENRRAE